MWGKDRARHQAEGICGNSIRISCRDPRFRGDDGNSPPVHRQRATEIRQHGQTTTNDKTPPFSSPSSTYYLPSPANLVQVTRTASMRGCAFYDRLLSTNHLPTTSCNACKKTNSFYARMRILRPTAIYEPPTYDLLQRLQKKRTASMRGCAFYDRLLSTNHPPLTTND